MPFVSPHQEERKKYEWINDISLMSQCYEEGFSLDHLATMFLSNPKTIAEGRSKPRFSCRLCGGF